MKTLVVIYEGEKSPFQDEKIFDGFSAYEKVQQWAEKVPNNVKTIILEKNVQTNAQLLNEIKVKAEENQADAIVFGFADCPFYDEQITRDLYEHHKKYGAEYTFADGYPYGLTPEIIDAGTIAILAGICQTNTELANQIVNKESFFSILKTDINSFEIETILAPFDYRYLRLQFCCDNKRNQLLCKRMWSLLKENPSVSIFELAKENASLLHTLPSYYNIQLTDSFSDICTYLPPLYKEGNKACLVRLNDFANMIKKIAEFSDDAVICLSFFGEALLHPNIKELIQNVLEYQGLSVLIETTGINCTEELIKEISEISNKAEKRTGILKDAITWIVSVDAFTQEKYASIHQKSEMNIDKTKEVIKILKTYFPLSVYPQFVRLQENEDELENFYRYWKEQYDGKFIIQKYDDFAGDLEQKKVADLSPVNRNVCWHICRDFNILLDGTVPLCKEIYPNKELSDEEKSKYFLGNALVDSLEDIWKKSLSQVENHVTKKYCGVCSKCDEYYTFNF